MNKLLQVIPQKLEPTGLYLTEAERKHIAEDLYAKGYRKASEVAREIFGELEATFYGDGFHYFIAMAVFDSLKKKYLGGTTDDGE